MEIYTETELNIALFCSFAPPWCYCKWGCPTTAWFARVSLDTSATLPVLASEPLIARVGEEPAGYVPLFLSVCPSANDTGTCTSSQSQPACRGYDWGLYAQLDSGRALPGDLDHDCDVDLHDLVTLLRHYGEASGGGAAYEDGDLFGDGGVDLSDLTGLLNHFGQLCP